MKGNNMTDMSKYKNVSLSKETYKILESLSKVLLPDAKDFSDLEGEGMSIH
jgi:hypothetical protein